MTPCKDEDSVDLEYARLALGVFSSHADVDADKIFAKGFSQNALWTAVVATCFPDKILRFAQAGSGMITSGGVEAPGKVGRCTASSFAQYGAACIKKAPCDGTKGEPRCDFHPIYPAAYVSPSLAACGFIYANDYLHSTQESMHAALVAEGHDSRYLEFAGGAHQWPAQKTDWVVSCLGMKAFCSPTCEISFSLCLSGGGTWESCWNGNGRSRACHSGCAPTYAMLASSERPSRLLIEGGSFTNWPERRVTTSTVTTVPTTSKVPAVCCQASIAICIACNQGASVESYCGQYPATEGCPTTTANGFSALTCNQLGWTSRVGSVCAESSRAMDVDGITDRCYSNRNQGTAHVACERKGARLCTVDEIETGVASGTGCGFDTAMVWTSTWCGLGPKYFTAMGDGSTNERSCKMYNKQRPVRCCADVDVSAVSLRDAGTTTTTLPAAARKSCDELGWGARVNGVCGEADKGLKRKDGSDKCFNNKNHPDANALCTGVGARLCSAAEITSGVGKSTGCKMDTQFVWTSTPCDADSFLGAKAKGETECMSVDTSAPLKCCSDEDVVSRNVHSNEAAYRAHQPPPPPPPSPPPSAYRVYGSAKGGKHGKSAKKGGKGERGRFQPW